MLDTRIFEFWMDEKDKYLSGGVEQYVLIVPAFSWLIVLVSPSLTLAKIARTVATRLDFAGEPLGKDIEKGSRAVHSLRDCHEGIMDGEISLRMVPRKPEVWKHLNVMCSGDLRRYISGFGGWGSTN